MNWIFVKGYGFLSFGKNMGRNISKSFSSKCSHKLLDLAKSMLQMHLKRLQKESFKKTAETTFDLIWNKIADKITRIRKPLPQNNLHTNEEILYMSPELRQKIIDNLRLKEV